ncbi:MAG: MFS transporter [Actinobacteria bacterium]|nr:MAG: MFS transporter [Actinomycetota bacterium]
MGRACRGDGGPVELLRCPPRTAGARADASRRARSQRLGGRDRARQRLGRPSPDALTLGTCGGPCRRAGGTRRWIGADGGARECGGVRLECRGARRRAGDRERGWSERERRERPCRHELVRPRRARVGAGGTAVRAPDRRLPLGRCASADRPRRRARGIVSVPRGPVPAGLGGGRARAPGRPERRSIADRAGAGDSSRPPVLHDRRGLSTGAAAAVLAAAQAVAIGLRIGVGRWSDRARARVGPLRLLGFAIAAAVAVSAALVSAPLVVLLPSLVVSAALTMAWNGLAFTAAAEFAGRARSGTALGFQQTSLSIAGTIAPIAFAAVVDAASWRTGFAVAALLPLGGAIALARLDESRPGMMRRCEL